MKIILLIIVPIFLVFACVLAVSLVPLPYPLSRSRNLIAAIGFGVFGIVYITGLTVYLIWSMLSRARNADPAFAQLGLDARSYVLFGRQYHGLVQGRQADVYLDPPYRYRPASLQVYLSASPRSRLAIGEKRPLLGCSGCQPLVPTDPDLGHLQILALDEKWTRDLLTNPDTKAAVLRLTTNASLSEHREIYVQPKTLLLRMNPDNVTAQGVRQWLQDLNAVAQSTEELAGAAHSIETPIQEPEARPRGDPVTPIVIVILAASALPVLLLCLGAVVLALLKKMR